MIDLDDNQTKRNLIEDIWHSNNVESVQSFIGDLLSACPFSVEVHPDCLAAIMENHET